MLISTPFEDFTLNGRSVHVKREDLCTSEEGPRFSKVRGVLDRLKSIPQYTNIGVLDTFHSKAGWGVAWMCQQLGRTCHVFYPVYKSEGSIENHALRYPQMMAEKFGAVLHPLTAGRSCILYHRAKKELQTWGDSYMMPNALKLEESISSTAKELIDTTPKNYLNGTWIVSISSGTIAAGVLQGLQYLQASVQVILHMGYSRSEAEVLRYISPYIGRSEVKIIDEGYNYKDYATFQAPFPCNPYYDLKAWKWLSSSIHTLQNPVTFWNIGA